MGNVRSFEISIRNQRVDVPALVSFSHEKLGPESRLAKPWSEGPSDGRESPLDRVHVIAVRMIAYVL